MSLYRLMSQLYFHKQRIHTLKTNFALFAKPAVETLEQLLHYTVPSVFILNYFKKTNIYIVDIIFILPVVHNFGTTSRAHCHAFTLFKI